jgi:hypothetical protein
MPMSLVQTLKGGVVLGGHTEQFAHDRQRQPVGERVDELGLAGGRDLVGQLRGLRPDERPEQVDGAGGERPADQAAQPAVVDTVVVDDHRHPPVVDRPGGDAVAPQVTVAAVVQPAVAQQFLRLGVAQHE